MTKKKLEKRERRIVVIAVSVFTVFALILAAWIVHRESVVSIDTPLHKHSHKHPPSYVDGTPYVLLQSSIEEWHPIRAAFIQGLLSEGNVYENTHEYAVEELYSSLEKIEDGYYADEVVPEDIDALDIHVHETLPFEHTESYRLESGKRLLVTIAYVDLGRNTHQWLVMDYDIYEDE